MILLFCFDDVVCWILPEFLDLWLTLVLLLFDLWLTLVLFVDILLLYFAFVDCDLAAICCVLLLFFGFWFWIAIAWFCC